MILNDIKGLGIKTTEKLSKLGIKDIKSLIMFYPFRYNIIKKSNVFNDGEVITIDGIVENVPNVFYINKKLDKMGFKLNIGTNILNVTIFNRGFLKNKLSIGTKITVIGKFDKLKNSITVTDLYFGLIEKTRIEPIYHKISGISDKQINNYINKALMLGYNVEDYIPTYLIEKYNFENKNVSIKNVHNPSSERDLNKSLNRLKYEELFMYMLKMNHLKNNKKNMIGLSRNVSFEKTDKFIKQLPFELTKDQLKSINDIYNDLMNTKRMNRLLQGDVGSGKTIVSFIAMYINHLANYQSCLMAPTEVLAKQHYNNLINIFKDYDIEIVLLTGSLKAKERKNVLDKIKNKSSFIVGTHALFTEDVVYRNLGLIITDEQHRFGVNQRSNLKNKGITPDVLYMSATPIPRTYALTLYGDMDVSSIKTMPSGKKEIKTIIKKESEMKAVLTIMYEQLRQNHQVYVIAPLVEESNSSDLKNIYELEEKFNRAFSKLYKIGVMHGKLKPKEKESIMESFIKNETNILICTTVIEVGVDVKNATMIVIFDSERFGLSTLHQLRGRVGRNDIQSTCVLISNYNKERLNILTKTNDGFKISEEDFRLRGSGDLFGYKQSGDMRFILSDLRKDYNILIKAKEDSNIFLNNINNLNNFEIEKYNKVIEKINDLD